MKTPTFEEILRKNSLRVTEPRLAVLKALSVGHSLFTLEELHKKIGQKKLDFATVYRSMMTFQEHGLVKSVELGDGHIRYELCGSDEKDHHHHHHVLCRKCGKIEGIELCGMAMLEKELRALGYREIEHRLEFKALCRSCK